MTTGEKAGLAFIIALFLVLCALLAVTVRPHSDASHTPEESIFVRQRVINLQKSNR